MGKIVKRKSLVYLPWGHGKLNKQEVEALFQSTNRIDCFWVLHNSLDLLVTATT